MLGTLPVEAEFCSRLRIREVVDAACPVRDTAELTHGQVIEALVANRLTSPAPLVHVQDWARASSANKTGSTWTRTRPRTGARVLADLEAAAATFRRTVNLIS